MAARGLMAAIAVTQANGKLKKGLCKWDEAAERYSSIVQMAKEVLNEKGLENSTYQEAGNALDDAIYNIAFERYVEHDSRTAISLLSGINIDKRLKARVLLGLCILMEARNGGDHKKFDLLYNYLKVLDTAQDVLAQEDIDAMDQVMIAEGYRALSTLFLFGVGVAKSVEKAHEVLEKGYHFLSDEDARDSIETELSHYKKKSFGGYQYSK